MLCYLCYRNALFPHLPELGVGLLGPRIVCIRILLTGCIDGIHRLADELLVGLQVFLQALDVLVAQVGNISPAEYLGYVRDVQCNGGETKYGGIVDPEILKNNLAEDCCIPETTAGMTIDDFSTFLEMRRKLIAQRLKEYYFSL